MNRTYTAKHLKAHGARMRIPAIGAKPVITAGLIGALVAPSFLSPLAAAAKEANAAQAPSAHDEHQQTAPSAVSDATAQLIAAASNNAKLTIDEAQALLASVQAAADAARAADEQQAQTLAEHHEQAAAAEASSARAQQAADAELTKQVGSLSAQLEAAQTAASKAASDKQAAERAHADLTSQLTAAQDDANRQHAAVEAARQARERAQAELDALGTNPAAAKQAAYDAAQKAHEQAKAAHERARADQSAAQTKLDSLTAQLAELQRAQHDADADLAAAQQDLTSAQTAYDTATATYAASVEALKAQALADEAAALKQAQDAYDAAAADDDASNDVAALEALNSAKAAYASAVETAGTQAAAQANAELSRKKQALDRAQQALADTQARLEAIPGKIEATKAAIGSYQTALASAQEQQAAAAKTLAAAHQELTDAQNALNDVEAAQNAWQEKRSELSQQLSDAEQALAQATAAKGAADQVVASLTSQISAVEQRIDSLKAELNDVALQAVDDFADFLVWLDAKTHHEDTDTSDCSTALGYLAHAAGAGWGTQPSGNLASFTTLGDAKDATAIDNVLKSLAVIDKLNELRVYSGEREVKVSLTAMVEAAFYANWSAKTNTIGHGSSTNAPRWGSSWGENAAWGSTERTVFNGWYWQEKADYTQQVQTDPVTGASYTPHAPGSPDYKTGHYLNVIDSDWRYTGAGYATNMPRYATSITNDFSQADQLCGHLTRDKTYTTEELRALIAQARAERVRTYRFEHGDVVFTGGADIEAQIVKHEAQRTGLREELAGAQRTQATAAAAQTGAAAARDEAQKAVDGLGTMPTSESARQRVETAQQALDAAQTSQATADQAAAQAQTAFDAKKAEIEQAVIDLESTWGHLQSRVQTLSKAVEDAQGTYDAAHTRYASLFAVGASYAAAKDARALAQTSRDAKRAAAQAATDALAAHAATVTAATTAKSQADQKAATAQAALAQAAQAATRAQTELDAVWHSQEYRTWQAGAEAVKSSQEALDAATAHQASADATLSTVKDAHAGATRALASATAAAGAASNVRDAWLALQRDPGFKRAVMDGHAADDATVTTAVTAAHRSYREQLQALAAARAELAAARAALEQATADKTTTTRELAEKLAELALAQQAYDRLVQLVQGSATPEHAQGEQHKQNVPHKHAEVGLEQLVFDPFSDQDDATGTASEHAPNSSARPSDTTQKPKPSRAAGAANRPASTLDATLPIIAGAALVGAGVIGAGVHARRRKH